MGRPRVPIDRIPYLTLAEVAVLLDQDLESDQPPAGATDLLQHPGGTDSYIRWWRSLTPAQRLERARQRWREEC